MKATQLPARYERLAKVVDTMNCGLVGSGLDGSVIFANERLLAWIQSDWDDIVGRPAVEFGVPAHGEELAAEIEALQEGDLRGRMLVMCRKDGTTFPALFIPQRLFGDDGKLEQKRQKLGFRLRVPIQWNRLGGRSQAFRLRWRAGR